MTHETPTATRIRIAGYTAADRIIEEASLHATTLPHERLRHLLFLAYLAGVDEAAEQMAETMAEAVKGAAQ